MRRQELVGPVLVAIFAVLDVVALYYLFVMQDDADTTSDVPVAVTASSVTSGPVDVVVVGDAWTDPHSQPDGGFLGLAAERLGWGVRVVEAGDGTGYLNRGPAEAGTFAERLRQQPVDPEVDLVVLQGGAADESVLAANPDRPLDRALRRALARVEERYADAEVLVLSPITSTEPSPVLVKIDRTLGKVSQAAGARFLSPLRRGWLQGATRSVEAGTGLPNERGRARLADHFEAAVERLQASLRP